jgi:putative ABC transport system substrate-binding protein
VLGLAATADLVGPQPRSASTTALLAGMRELGYVYGDHFVTEPRGAHAQPQRFPDLVTELLRAQVDVIVAVGPALPMLKRATTTVPVVMAAAVDPVAQGFAQSLGRPGGNFIGLSLQSLEITGKRLELMKELVPGAATLAVLWNRSSEPSWQAAQATLRQLRWNAFSLEIHNVDEIDSALRKAVAAKAGALLVFAASALYPHAQRVTDQVAKHRLPAMYELRSYVEAGGLVSYGADINDIWRRSAVFVDKILKGSRPADLPIEQPSEFELVINLKAARALGLTVPQAMLLRAEEVIQ